MGRARFADPAQERLEKLRAYDAAAGEKDALAQERLALSQERFADSQSRDARDFAFREAQAATKSEMATQAAAQRAAQLQGVNEIQNQRLLQADTQLQLSQRKAELEAAEKAAKETTTLRILEDASGFMKDAVGMNPASPEFDQQIQKLYAGYPLAAEHPSVKSWQSYHLPLREKFVAAEIASQKPPDLGDRTVVTDASGNTTTTIKQPLKPGDLEAEDRRAILAKHNALESTVNANSGKPQDPATIAELNSLKARLGFAPIGGSQSATAPASIKPLPDDIAKSARAAIAAGKDPAAVAKRLQESGYDATGL